MSFDSHIQALEADALATLRKNLLGNIRAGNTNLQSGGIGLEQFVAELLRAEGYATRILAKTAFEGTADADIEAFREDRFSSNKLLIQVKHHNGITGCHALRQLQSLDNDDDAQKWVITTGDVVRPNQLAPATLNRLGLSTAPTLLI